MGEDWANKPRVKINVDIQPGADYTSYMLEHAMICYFTSQPPLLDEFCNWIYTEFMCKKEWPILHVKFLGKNFYLVLFEVADHREAA